MTRATAPRRAWLGWPRALRAPALGLALLGCDSEPPSLEAQCDAFAETRCQRLLECAATRNTLEQCVYTNRYTCVAIEAPSDPAVCTAKLEAWPCELLPDTDPPECRPVRRPARPGAN